jgi:hypothetical protein
MIHTVLIAVSVVALVIIVGCLGLLFMLLGIMEAFRKRF